MKSFIAALRNLVLPFGQTTGARIVLNGDSGAVLVYDTNNNLIASMAPMDAPDGSYLEGIVQYQYVNNDPAQGGSFIQLQDGDITFGQWSGAPPYLIDGFIGQDNAPGSLVFSPPSFTPGGSTGRMTLNSVASDTTNPNLVLAGGGGQLTDQYMTGFLYQTFDGLTQETFQAAALLNGGTQGVSPVSFRMLPSGHVELRGTLVGGTLANGTHLFQLPAASVFHRTYRPVTNYRMLAVAQNTGGSTFGSFVVDVLTTGFISCFGVPTGLTQLHFDNVLIPLE
jgi:hypothetical protein